MRVLALDTATTEATVAVCDGDRVVCERGRTVTTHSEGLLELVDEALGEAGFGVDALDGIACGEGPGSFTGLRIGLATAKGLCFASAKPLLCVPSMVGVAGPLAVAGEARVVAVVLDARRGEVFCGLYRAGEPLGDPVLLPPSAVRDYLAEEVDGEVVLAGDGATRYHAEQMPGLALALDGFHRIRAGPLALYGRRRLIAGEAEPLERAVPRYLRAPDVRLPATPQALPRGVATSEESEQ